MKVLLVLPVIIPALTGILTLLLRRSRRAQRVLSVLGATALLGASSVILWNVQTEGIQVAQMGDWAAPFGITLVADAFSAGLITISAFVALAVAVYALRGMDVEREFFGFHTLLHLLMMGINGAFITGDLFNMYVWFEVLLIASFVLLVLGNEERQLDGAVKYVGINLVASVSFLTAIGLLYGFTGSLNFADIATSMGNIREAGLEATIAALFLVGFGIKAGLFPLYFWLPASYHTPPAPVSAIFAGLLTKVGVYSLIRIFTLLFPEPTGYTKTLLLVVAGLTMVIGVLGAVTERNVNRLLAFLVISAMGYVVMGLGFFTTLGLAGAVFYIFQDIPVKASLFLIGGVMERETGTTEIGKMGGLYTHRPLLALAFIVPAFSLAGFPPFPGFWGKLTLVQAGLETENYLIVAVALLVGALTLLVVGQLWARAFWSPAREDGLVSTDTFLQRSVLQTPIVVLAVALFAVGLYAQPLFELAHQAATNLTNTAPYIQAVLG
ncbi:Na+/H+ antiporter subunit D [Longibacter salinarum]|uniref:Na+/H+ antiporter subunit D n=1 Tax=Longibacter salinarum TaxID=1850348 RepID=A0A2A8CW31_9BACT|nr:proton-conducting transporter membrane subunit [Longibacter salinarum]PEN12856.1 Na+/H+ antiporter subunit D [Longibacter salinarum]